MRKLIFMCLMMFATAALAQQIDLKSLDKFGDRAKSKTEINMDESMLKSAISALNEKKGDEATAKKSVQGIKGFYLRSFEFGDNDSFKLEDLKPLLDQLKAPNWKSLLRSKEEDEQTEIWMHMTNGEADGLVLISAERNELTVINGIGVTNLSDLKALGNLNPLK